MEGYKTRAHKIPGTKWPEVSSRARMAYSRLVERSKRRPYIRSAYFCKRKIFISIFWHHLYEKFGLKQKTSRLKFYNCAIELLIYNRCKPIIDKVSDDKKSILYRFFGNTPSGERFFVQVKEDAATKELIFLSVFPE